MFISGKVIPHTIIIIQNIRPWKMWNLNHNTYSNNGRTMLDIFQRRKSTANQKYSKKIMVVVLVVVLLIATHEW